MKEWINENCLDIIIIAVMFGIMLAIYAGYKFFAEPETRTVTTVITLPSSDSPVRSYGSGAGDAP